MVGVVNWFLFSAVTFLMMEVPFAPWYLKKFDVDISDASVVVLKRPDIRT